MPTNLNRLMRCASSGISSDHSSGSRMLAQRTASRPTRKLLSERADIIVRDWGLPADKWVRVFKPVRA